MDEDVEQMSRDQLVAEVKRLRQGIRRHRDSTGHELVLAPPGLVGTTAGSDRPAARSAGLAAVPAGVHPLPAVAQRAGAGAPRTAEAFGG